MNVCVTGTSAKRRRYLMVGVVASVLPSTILAQEAQAPGAGEAAPAGAVQIPEVRIQSGIERGTSPVDGFVAGVSATGTKTDTPLIETPQSISVVTADEIEARDARTVTQALRYTAGTVTDIRGSTAVRLDALYFRGYTPASYLDGLRVAGGRDANPSTDAYRIERLEVLRGPASVLYGSSPPGGLFNIVTKRPTDERIREVLLEAGTRDRYRAAFDLSGRLDADGKWLGRVVGSYSEGDGELDRTRERRYFISPTLTWRPDTDTTVTVFGHYQHDPEGGSYGSVPAYGSVLPNPNGRIRQRFYDGDPDFEKSNREHYYIGYQAEHRATEWLTLRQNARYLHTQGQYRSIYNAGVTPDYRQMVRSAFGTDVDIDVFTIDNQAQGRFRTGPFEHLTLAGLDYFRVLTDTYQASALSTTALGQRLPRLDLFNPNYDNQGSFFPPFSSYSSQRQNQMGVYLQDQIKYDRLTLLLGGRLDWSDTTTENKNLTTQTLASRTRSTASAATGRAGAVYRFDNGIAPYASYSESFEPQAGTDRLGSPFRPTTGRQYEVGIRYQPTGTNLLLSAAAFDLLRENVLTTDPVNPGFSVQQGETRSRGLEFEAKATLMAGLSFTANYSYTDVEFSKTRNTTVIDLGFFPTRTGGTVALQGKTPWGVPTHLASGWVDYTFQEGNRLAGLGVGGGVRYIGSSWGDDANTFKVPDATLLDLSVRYDLGQLTRTFQGATASVNISNLADTRYVSSCFSYSSCWYGTGRVVLGNIRYRF
ncbi:TonB-dependent siderophore receptor [Roseomonas populi]|uniref:TonB-dependent siderophore receptor n=1 Tax=Roseomonas populi TaxID=3121582 RepID=A0ABT1XAQ0_9PROT|nr:TonB-dependent siderophore receptor [Roseomonas pecuniae]MCR0985180.1 TonB-dependent siderophore receptor [Roseomonas pecuniae]